jgi:hypothetical protein
MSATLLAGKRCLPHLEDKTETIKIKQTPVFPDFRPHLEDKTKTIRI